MMDELRVTDEELRRVKAWIICLTDALAYIALARDRNDFLVEDKFFKYKAGQMRVGHAIEKGLIAAAIVSAGQIFKAGDQGTGIADNQGSTLRKLRGWLFECSDQGNAWPTGTSESIFSEKVSVNRDRFLSHFDGTAANISVFGENQKFINWRPPNPWFRSDAFLDLEHVLYQMLRSLERWVRMQELANDTDQRTR